MIISVTDGNKMTMREGSNGEKLRMKTLFSVVAAKAQQMNRIRAGL